MTLHGNEADFVHMTRARDATRTPTLTPRTVGAVGWFLVHHPVWLVQQWNWKSAVLSSAVRSSLFFGTNLQAGLSAARAAWLTEFVLRALTAGFYGATTQAFRRAQPAWAATAAVSVLLPLMTHAVELGVHWIRQTPELMLSVAVSAVFTILSTQFNLYAMRRDVLIVGSGSPSLLGDLRLVPALIHDFVGGALGDTSWAGRRMLVGGSLRRGNRPPESDAVLSGTHDA